MFSLHGGASQKLYGQDKGEARSRCTLTPVQTVDMTTVFHPSRLCGLFQQERVCEGLEGRGCLFGTQRHHVHFDQAERPPPFHSDSGSCKAALMSSKRPYVCAENSSPSEPLIPTENPYIFNPLQESHKRATNEKREPLDEDQLFVVDLARDLSRVCQVTMSSMRVCLHLSNPSPPTLSSTFTSGKL